LLKRLKGEIKLTLVNEYLDFLKEYKIIELAIAFIMGTAATVLIKSLVDNIIMPIITVFIPNGEWKTAKLIIGNVVISWGQFLSDLIYFLIVGLIIFIFVKKLMKLEVAKK